MLTEAPAYINPLLKTATPLVDEVFATDVMPYITKYLVNGPSDTTTMFSFSFFKLYVLGAADEDSSPYTEI